MGNKTIEVVVSPNGEISIEAVGFKGADCDSATKYLEQALGTVGQRNRKPEYLQTTRNKQKQRIGG